MQLLEALSLSPLPLSSNCSAEQTCLTKKVPQDMEPRCPHATHHPVGLLCQVKRAPLPCAEADWWPSVW
jgi:hypothetical protein